MTTPKNQKQSDKVINPPSLPDRTDLGKLYPTPRSEMNSISTSQNEAGLNNNLAQIHVAEVVMLSAWLTLPVLTFMSIIKIALSITLLEFYHISLIALVGLAFTLLLIIVQSKVYSKFEKHDIGFSPGMPYLIFFLLFVPQLKLLGNYLIIGNTLLVILIGTTLSFLTALIITVTSIAKVSLKKKVYILSGILLIAYCTMAIDIALALG